MRLFLISCVQVQVAVSVAGLNFADMFAIQGLYSATPSGSTELIIMMGAV